MKYYSEYTAKYVQDVCNTLNDAGIVMPYTGKSFSPDKFNNLTELLQDYIVYNSNIYQLLNMKGLVNRGQCPYTGQKTDSKSANYSYFDRKVYVSRTGLDIMRREAEINYAEIMGEPAPQRQNVQDNKGCFVLMALPILLFALFSFCYGANMM
jgi:hypothetical protein